MKKNLQFFLQYIFDKPGFREGQFEAISRALMGQDAVVLLPTGHGKSIAFQLASFLLPGIAVVIDPIISLIDDQIDNLKLTGIDRCAGITSQITNKEDLKEMIDLFSKGEFLFCYIAPERFQTKQFRQALRALTVSIPICLIAVDEAHCVSEWGHDFRTSYLNIGRTSREYCKSKNVVPPLLALTGTASRVVLKDVIRVLDIQDFEAIITPKTFDRKELSFTVMSVKSKEKFQILQGLMNVFLPSKFNIPSHIFHQNLGENTYSGLVFCPHVNGAFGVYQISQDIQSKITNSVDFYSGSKPKYFSTNDYNEKKRASAFKFKNNRTQVLVATKAFGMGIDKPNIRFTVHYGIPNSIEAFYQEAGRAGRDRKTSHCVIIYSNDDRTHNNRLLDPNSTYTEVQELMESSNIKDDINRVMFFHTNAFKGVAQELRHVEAVLKKIPDINKKQEYNFVIKDVERNEVEKGIHRLITLGIVEDYTLDYSSGEFTVVTKGVDYEGIINSYAEYVNGYHRGRMNEEVRKAKLLRDLPTENFIISISRLLIEFIYDVLEKSRRRSLNEMDLLCAEGTSNEQIKEKILSYLQTEFSESIELLLEEEESGLGQVINIVESIRSVKDAVSIRGEVARYLESYPDHPGLLFLRGIVEFFTQGYNTMVAEQNLIAAVRNGLGSYGITPTALYETIGWTLSTISERNSEFVKTIVNKLIQTVNDTEFLRKLILYLPSELNDIVAVKLLTQMSGKVLDIFEDKG